MKVMVTILKVNKARAKRGFSLEKVMTKLSETSTEERIKYLKGMVKSDTPPKKCYTDIPDGKSGNYKLGVNCFYCSYKKEGWSDSNNGHGLRVFDYKKGPVYLTRVNRLPDVPEIFI